MTSTEGLGVKEKETVVTTTTLYSPTIEHPRIHLSMDVQHLHTGKRWSSRETVVVTTTTIYSPTTEHPGIP